MANLAAGEIRKNERKSLMTQIFAHRGSAGTHPENTFASYRAAVKAGSDGIEIDVHLTKDQDLVVIHDATVSRTTNGKGFVKDFTLKEIKELDAGSWFAEEFKDERIPTLEEVLVFMSKNELLLNIELKNIANEYHGIEEKVIDMVGKYGLTNRVIISSFNHISLNKISRSNPEIECAILTLDKQYEPWNYIASVGVDGIHPQWSKTDKEMITEAQQRNHPVRVYTINKEAYMEAFITYKSAAIITDYPEMALEVRDRLQKHV